MATSAHETVAEGLQRARENPEWYKDERRLGRLLRTLVLEHHDHDHDQAMRRLVATFSLGRVLRALHRATSLGITLNVAALIGDDECEAEVLQLATRDELIAAIPASAADHEGFAMTFPTLWEPWIEARREALAVELDDRDSVAWPASQLSHALAVAIGVPTFTDDALANRVVDLMGVEECLRVLSASWIRSRELTAFRLATLENARVTEEDLKRCFGMQSVVEGCRSLIAEEVIAPRTLRSRFPQSFAAATSGK